MISNKDNIQKLLHRLLNDYIKKNKLYVAANQWMIEKFQNAESVIQFQDKEEGVLIGKYLLHKIDPKPNNLYGISTPIYCIIKLQVKDKTAKITINPEDYTYVKSPYIYEYPKEMAVASLKGLISNFESYLANYNDDF